ncbi:MAG: DUF4274 domain-containing protein [Ruminococcus sp.]|nr:DUF4274 domain-containing protein [Ruminococcus sp.]
MNFNEKKNILADYNWDDGFKFPSIILRDKNCDLATALEIFYLADGDSYLFLKYDDKKIPDDSEWINFVESLYCDILSGNYTKNDNHYKIPLGRVPKYQLKKLGVPDIFLKDI